MAEDTPMDKSRRGIQSIEIGGRLLTALVDEGGPMSLGDLARKAGMPSAKAHPYLVSFKVASSAAWRADMRCPRSAAAWSRT